LPWIIISFLSCIFSFIHLRLNKQKNWLNIDKFLLIYYFGFLSFSRAKSLVLSILFCSLTASCFCFTFLKKEFLVSKFWSKLVLLLSGPPGYKYVSLVRVLFIPVSKNLKFFVVLSIFSLFTEFILLLKLSYRPLLYSKCSNLLFMTLLPPALKKVLKNCFL
jgi:hypothetical protein